MRAVPRRVVGLISLLVLVAIGVGVTGIGPGLDERAAAPALPGVRLAVAAALFRVGRGAPPGGELGFIAAEPSGNLVVSDAKRNTVMRFDAAGQLLSEWGPSFGDTQLGEPAGVGVFGEQYYVVDRGTPRVLRLDATGRITHIFDLATYGTYGLNGLAIDQLGNLYVADTGRNRLLVLSPTGSLAREVGHSGSGLGEFTQPWTLAFASNGGFFVADWENARIEGWDAQFTATDAWSTGFRPFGVAVDRQGRVFVPDTDRARIFAYTPHGALLGELGGPEATSVGVSAKQLVFSPRNPSSLYALDDDGVVRLDLEDTPPPPQGGESLDIPSLLIVAGLLAFVVVAVLRRRPRRAVPALVGTPSNGPVGLHAEDRTQRQDQQSRRNQQLVVTHQPERKQQSAEQDHHAEPDREPHRGSG